MIYTTTKIHIFVRFWMDNYSFQRKPPANHASALYGSAALDLPRRGVNHVIGGMGALADTLVGWIRQQWGAKYCSAKW